MSNKFKYLINCGNGYEQIKPQNPDILFGYTKENRQAFARKVSNTQLLFCSDDFKLLYEKENSCDRCDRIPFKVEICCQGEWKVYFEGYFNFDKGVWNEDKCEVSIQPQPLDEYTCIFDHWETSINLIDCTEKIEVQYYLGEIECEVCEDLNIEFDYTDPYPTAQCDPFLDVSEGWAITRNCLFGVRDLADIGIDRLRAQKIQTTFCREFFADTTGNVPPGVGWVSVSGGWARPIISNYLGDVISADSDIQATYDVKQNYQTSGIKSETVTLDNGNERTDYTECVFSNGMKLQEAINCLLQECELEVKSNFFGWNVDGTGLLNVPYTCADVDLQCLALFQKTDITDVDSFEDATKAEIKLKDLLECLTNTFAVKWFVKDGFLCIEHESYCQKTNGWDLTGDKHKDCLRGKGQYTYLDASKPQFERFTWMDSGSQYFDGSDIEYNTGCTDMGEEETYPVDCWSTDVDYGVRNPTEINTDGFYLVSVLESGGTYYVNESNTPLSWTELHECYHCHNRPQWQGIVNGELKCFESVHRQKQQTEIELPFSCADLLAFDAEQLVNTQFGWAEVTNFSFSVRTCYASLTPLHEEINCCE